MSRAARFGKDAVRKILPQRPPFLFVDRVMSLRPDARIVAEVDLVESLPHFAGHFPGRPIMPGVLVTEALAQTSGLLLGLSEQVRLESEPEAPRVFFLASAHTKYLNPALPGETLRLTARAGRSFQTLFHFDVEASVGRKLVAEGKLTLARIEERT